MFRRSSPRPAARAVRAAPSLRGGHREATDEAVLGPRPERFAPPPALRGGRRKATDEAVLGPRPGRSAPLRHCEEAIEKRPTKQSSVRDPGVNAPPRCGRHAACTVRSGGAKEAATFSSAAPPGEGRTSRPRKGRAQAAARRGIKPATTRLLAGARSSASRFSISSNWKPPRRIAARHATFCFA